MPVTSGHQLDAEVALPGIRDKRKIRKRRSARLPPAGLRIDTRIDADEPADHRVRSTRTATITEAFRTEKLHARRFRERLDEEVAQQLARIRAELEKLPIEIDELQMYSTSGVGAGVCGA